MEKATYLSPEQIYIALKNMDTSRAFGNLVPAINQILYMQDGKKKRVC